MTLAQEINGVLTYSDSRSDEVQSNVRTLLLGKPTLKVYRTQVGTAIYARERTARDPGYDRAGNGNPKPFWNYRAIA